MIHLTSMPIAAAREYEDNEKRVLIIRTDELSTVQPGPVKQGDFIAVNWTDDSGEPSGGWTLLEVGSLTPPDAPGIAKDYAVAQVFARDTSGLYE